ncbi:MAG: hypothetical protein N2037_06875 [Acidimicrobiales bacterium]|nr:hypothetical protein [Acidimicrobiales bacterium]
MTIHKRYTGSDRATVDVLTGDWVVAAAHLRDVMHDQRFTPGYLTWLYDQNPVGDTVAVDICDDDDEIIAHGAALPQRLRKGDREALFVLIVNAAVQPRAQGNNIFATKIIEHIPYVLEQGCIGGYGVTNERSTVPSLRLDGLGAHLVSQLPLKICPPLGTGAGVASYDVDEQFLSSELFEEVAGQLDEHPAENWTQRWTPELLRWRLSRPDVRYAMHIGDRAVAITTKSTAWGTPVAVITKLLPRRPWLGTVSGRELVAAACRHHRAPSAFYAGFNACVRVRGVSVPRKYMPSPLNLMFLTLSDLDPASFGFDIFEFLDFDAL